MDAKLFSKVIQLFCIFGLPGWRRVSLYTSSGIADTFLYYS